MKNLNKVWITIVVLIGLQQVSFAQMVSQEVSLGTSKDLMNSIKTNVQNKNAKISSEVELIISSTQKLRAKINYAKSGANSEYIVGEISDVKDGSFYMNVSDKSLEGHVILRKSEKAYQYFSDASGNAFVKEVDIHELICVNYANQSTKQAKSTEKQAAVTIAQALLNLQSLPGAAGCVLLDFDGYYMPAGNYWNGGNPINAAHSGMSDAAVQEHWEVVAEDFRPFNVNITTNEGVFNSYPRNRRMRVVVTPTNTAAPGAGGVAYIGSFNWDNDVPCWTFITSGKSGGEASSHEIGHTFDLQHDGRSNPDEGYFGGIDGTPWAPIMGVGYYRPVTQWSKGEYRNAKNDRPGVLQDDIAVIASSKFGVGFRADDYGNGIGAANTITYNNSGVINQKNGIIENEGDWDFFTFTTGGGNVVINANTVSRHGNLDLIIRLYNASGSEIGSYTNTAQGALNASMNVNLGAGKYYISIDGTGWGDPAYGGYSAYGSLGSYSITGTIPPGGAIAPSTGVVTAYKDCNYGGFSGGLAVGDYTLAQMNALGILNDDISSLRVAEGFKAILYADNNFSGASIEITADNSCLVAAGWNDRATSMRVRTNGVTNISGTYCVQNRLSGLFLDVVGGTGNMNNGANIQQWNPTAANNQQFEFTHLGDGTYKIIATHSGKSIDINNFSQNDGANVEQYTYNATPNQQFVIVNAGSGFVKLIAKHSGKVIEVAGFSTAPEANVQQWSNVNQTSGHWKIVTPTTGIVTAYRDCNYAGFSGGFGVGNYTQRQMATVGVKDNDVSSLRVTSGYKVILYENDNFGGASIEYTADNSCVVANGWNDRASSMRVLTVTNNPPPPNQAPTVSLTGPSNNATYNAPASINITANASDADGNVTKVEFYNGGTKIGEDASAPYSLTWSNVGAGTYTISARAFDNNNASTTSGSITVKVNTVVVTDQCTGLATYSENNGYVPGSKVKNAGRQYECREWPYSGWCNGASWAYAPGTGLYWTDAWIDRGSCNARSANDMAHTETTESLLISPNPVQDELTISSSYNLSGGSFMIVDMTGKMVYQSNASEAINTANLDAGIYTLILITAENEKMTKRFVKVK